MTDTPRVFRMSTRLLLWAAIAHLVLVSLMLGAIWLAGRGVDLIALGCIFIIPAFFWVTYILRFRLTVEADCLRWMNRSGVACGACWSQIGRAELSREFGLPQLSLWMADGDGPFHIPMVLSDVEGFKEAVADSAGPDHPVTRALSGQPADAQAE